MAASTPVRRPSYATALSDLTSPPSSIPRRASSVASSFGSPSVSGTGTDRKKRNRNLLRDYYGLSGAKAGDPLDLVPTDSPSSFNPEAYFQSLTSTASLPDLLKRENELLNEIRELDGERQSLVYNHHHELIEASDTIRKMKSRAEALDTSLDSLKASFQSISQLSASLAPPAPSTCASRPPPSPMSTSSHSNPPQTPTRRLPIVVESPDTPITPTTGRLRSASAATAQPSPSPATQHFDPLVHLPALLALPVLLRSLLASDRSKGDALWGSWEPALRSWEDEGVEGVREIGQECRDVLRTARRVSVSERRE
ncbi:SPOSA6832_00256, partial [Sporobolomyces salmonicolor]